MKKSYYFSHDFNARTDPKLIRLFMKHGLAGIGLFWCIIEMIHEQNGYIHKDECERIAFEMRTHSELVTSVLTEFDLFCFNGESYYSKSALERIKIKEEKSQKATTSAKFRWENANAMRTHSEGNAIKEKKRKEKKYIDTVSMVETGSKFISNDDLAPFDPSEYDELDKPF